jgi:hypothetical protein
MAYYYYFLLRFDTIKEGGGSKDVMEDYDGPIKIRNKERKKCHYYFIFAVVLF